MRRLTRRAGLIASLFALALIAGLFVAPAPARAQGGANAVMIPESATQSTDLTVKLQLSGFAPDEAVVVWQTFPDFTVLPRGSYAVNSAGVASIDVEMDETFPIGTHYLSVRGDESNAYVIAEFELLPPMVQVDRGVTIDVSQGGLGATQGGYYSFMGQGYQPRETVAMWLTYPDGTVRDMGTVRASSGGDWSAAVTFGWEDQVGMYYLTGYGTSSERTGVAQFIVSGGMFVDIGGEATLEANRGETRQLEMMELHGSGFTPGEVVSIWLTESDGSVWFITELVATNGEFILPGYLAAVIPDEGSPIGETTFSAYGNYSKRFATVTVQLWAGSGL